MRKLAIAAAVSSSLATISVNSLALGLGDIEMYSALNQALDAEINILTATPEELESVQVRIASDAAFASAGLAKSPLLSSLLFNIERRADGSPIIKVTSDAPVVEPFLNFLVEVDSDVTGRQVREFTVLLDPPIFTAQQTQPAVATVVESEEIDIASELGASSPILRSSDLDNSVAAGAEAGAVVTISEQPDATLITEPQGEVVDLTGVVEADELETVDLASTVASEPLEGVDLDGADNVVVSIDGVDSLVIDTTGTLSEGTDDLLTDAAATSAGVTQATDDAAAAEVEDEIEGELIPLDPALLNSSVPAPAAPVSDDAGELLQLDDLSGTGRPIFESETSDSLVEGSIDQGARVDLTDLLPVELVTDEPAAVADDVPALDTLVVDDTVNDTTADAPAPVGVAIDLSQDLLGQPELPAQPVADLLVSDNAGASESADDGAELVDLSSLEGIVPDSSSDQSQVIVDNIEVVAVADVAPLSDFVTDTDADVSDGVDTSASEGVALDLSGLLATPPVANADANSADINSADAGTLRVGPQDTLWSLAEDNKPSGVSTQQMMVALLEANQNAFLDGDMNQMRVGSVLTMPGFDTATAVARGEALAMVREQTVFQQARQELADTANLASESTVTETVTTDVSELQDAVVVDDAEQVVTDAQGETAPIATTENAENNNAGLQIVGVDETASGSGTPSTDELSSGDDLSRDLDDVNRRVQLAQEELASEAMQRDELQGRVDDLASSMNKMKRLITLRESELSNLQNATTEDAEVADAEVADSDVADTDAVADTASDDATAMVATPEETQNRIREMQEKISDEAIQAQDRIAAQADADKNLAAAEAEAQRIRVANEQDALKSQLATLRAEKAELERTAQLEKAELVQAAEAEKTALLEQAQAEQDRIQARLEEEKARITAEAEAEKQAIAADAQAENERLIAEANAERERLAEESNEMRIQLEALEAEKNELLAQAEINKQQLQESADENLRLQAEAEAERQRADDQARIRERLAEEQAKAAANLASADAGSSTTGGNTVDRTGAGGTTGGTDTDAAANGADSTDTANTVENTTDNTVSGTVNEAVNAVGTTASNVAGSVSDTASDVAGKGLAAGGAMAGLLSYEPLQRVMGDRTRALAAGGGIALLGLLASLAWRRQTRVVKEDINIDDGVSMVDDRDYQRASVARDEGRRPANGVTAAATAATAAAAAVRTDAAEASVEEQTAHVQERVQDRVDSHRMADEVDTDTGHGGLQDDTLTEAEVYLRYGLHGQAEELLSSAIDRDPNNREYHFKLLENYHDQKNPSGFRAAATTFQDKFGATEQWERIAEMGRDLDPGDSLYSRAGAMDVRSAATGAVAGVTAAGAAVGATLTGDADTARNNAVARDAANVADIEDLPDDFLTADAPLDADLDDTIDPGAEFDLSELEATGQFDATADEPASLEDVTLDEIDLAALDDDGTLNLEEIAGEEMSGLDLGALDFGDADVGSSLDNLTLDDANLNSLDDMTALRDGLETDGADDLDAGLNSRVDEMETMLDLAKAYIDMGDNSSAIGPLKDIAANGSPAQQSEAAELLRKLN